jgi:hypothetical protein
MRDSIHDDFQALVVFITADFAFMHNYPPLNEINFPAD